MKCYNCKEDFDVIIKKTHLCKTCHENIRRAEAHRAELEIARVRDKLNEIKRRISGDEM